MLVTRDQLQVYEISDEFWFARRTGSGDPISRDQYFINFPNKLQTGMYCAVGNDIDGWELEQYNGVNWVISAPDKSYRLVITSQGLKSLTDTVIGGYKLVVSGVKIIDQTVGTASIPLVEWTDENFISSGNVVFTVGTLNSPNNSDDDGEDGTYSNLRKILCWTYNNTSGGLQYCLDLPPEGLGAKADSGSEEWDIGTIGLYVKDTDGVHDVLFAIAALPSVIRKYAKNIGKIGNRLRFYMNTVLSNLGFVSNLDVLEDGNQSLPEIPNESLLDLPADTTRRINNCYLVDDLYGSGMPALAVPMVKTNSLNSGDRYTGNWVYFQPSENYIYVGNDKFNNVKNYEFVYWNAQINKYERAEGRYQDDVRTTALNEKMAIGVRVGNNIVYSGEVTNLSETYQYKVKVINGGNGYRQGDLLDIVVVDNLIIRVKVTSVNNNGAIVFSSEEDGIIVIGPTSGPIDLGENAVIADSIYYANESQLPRRGNGARVSVTCEYTNKYVWNFSSEWINKPVYCDRGKDENNYDTGNAGKPTLTVTDSFLGWVTSKNSIRLALDLRNEANENNYGTTRYATDTHVREIKNYEKPAKKYSVTPEVLQKNYIQRTKPTNYQNSTQDGANWDNPIHVSTCIKWDEMIVGKNVDINTDKQSQHWSNGAVDFWGKAYRAEWADLAEYYEADKIYEPGTLITFGAGSKEISEAQFEADGVISSKPGLQLGEKKNNNYLPVALTGRVPVLMDGNSINYFGDKIYLSKIKPGTASTIKNGKCIGKIVDKNPGTKRLVECVVSIDFNN